MASNDLLIVYPLTLWPVTGGGARRTLDLMVHLRNAGVRVTMVTIDHAEHYTTLATLCDELVTLPPPPPTLSLRAAISGVSRAVRRAARGRANALAASRNRALEELAAKTAARIRPHAVLVHFARMAYAFDRMPPSTLKVVDTIDIQHQRHANARAGGGQLDQFVCTREEEAAALDRANVLLAITPEDRDVLRGMCPRAEVLLIGHAIEPPPFEPSSDASREILFVGNLYDPNVRAIRQFLADAWPLIREGCRDATLTVCGRVCEAIDRAPNGVTLAGRVDDLAPYYRRAAVVINPAPYGTGLPIKTTEALAWGRAIVGTAAGLRGVPAPAEAPWREAAAGPDTATAVVELLTQLPTRHLIERRAYEFARSHGPAKVYAPLLDLLRADRSNT